MCTSLDVDPEARHLRQVRGAGELEHVHIVKDLAAVEPADDEEPAVGEQRGVVAPRGRRAACDGAALVRQGHCGAGVRAGEGGLEGG